MTRDGLPLARGADLPPLGWQHNTALDLAWMQPVADGPLPIKPSGGLWTSPLHGDGRTAWTEWCATEDYSDPSWPITKLLPDADAAVYVINNAADVVALERACPGELPECGRIRVWPCIDWPAVARDIDAVWLTEKGQWATRFSRPGLNGWDCETVYWLQPRFRVAPPVGGAS